jgi:predicted nucleic acid-binding protein
VTEALVSFVDTNVLFDVLTNDPRWAEWSIRQLEITAIKGAAAINDIVYAELSVRYSTVEAVDRVVEQAGLKVERMSRSALFLAGKAFQRYRSQGGRSTTILPDFFIGAHAATLGVPLLTRDARRYRTYFPTLELVTP